MKDFYSGLTGGSRLTVEYISNGAEHFSPISSHQSFPTSTCQLYLLSTDKTPILLSGPTPRRMMSNIWTKPEFLKPLPKRMREETSVSPPTSDPRSLEKSYVSLVYLSIRPADCLDS
jgi:hypothetical protein